MAITASRLLAWAVPSSLQRRYPNQFSQVTKLADQIVSGRDDRAVAQRTALFAFTIRILSAAIAYVSQVLLARWMGGHEYGIFVVVWVGAVILGGLSCLGFQTAVVRLVPEYQAAGSQDELRGVVRGSLSYSFGAATLIAIVGISGVFLLSDLLTNYYVLPLYLGAICLPMLALSEVQDGVARAFNWPNIALTPTFIIRPMLILVAFGGALSLGYSATAETALIATIGATYVASLYQLLSLRRSLKKVVPAGGRTVHPLKWTLIALPIFLVEGFFNLLTNVDILVVGHYMPPDQVAVYFASVKTLALVHFVYFAVKAGAAHRFSQYRAAGDHNQYQAFISDTVRWTFWPSVALSALLLLVGEYLLLLFGEEFTQGYPLLFILVIGIVARSAVGPAESVLTMSGEQKVCAGIYGVTLFLNVALNITFIPIYGLYGAAISTSIAMMFEATALYAIAKRRLGIHLFIIGDQRPVASAEAAE
ncbi:MAG: lipopolysaccharide biosynthesis protein [Pseudomonadota bacterium]